MCEKAGFLTEIYPFLTKFAHFAYGHQSKEPAGLIFFPRLLTSKAAKK
jgi:hypothetical protein